MKRLLEISFWVIALAIFASGMPVREDSASLRTGSAQLTEKPAGSLADYALEANSLFVAPVQRAEYCSRSSQSEVPSVRLHNWSVRRPAESGAQERTAQVWSAPADVSLKDAVELYVYMLHRLRI